MTYTLYRSERIIAENRELSGGILIKDEKFDKVLSNQECEDYLDRNNDVRVVDVGRLALLPGVVDSHVHVNEPGRTHWEGFRTATAAAAAGGVTTILDMPLNSIPPTTTVEHLKAKVSAAEGNVYVDVGFWGGVVPGNAKDLRKMVEAGVVGFKCFLCPSGVEEFPNVNKKDLELAIAELEGTGSVLAFHAELEDEAAPESNTGKLVLILATWLLFTTDPSAYETYLQSRPADMEIAAIQLISDLATQTNLRMHIVHVSSADCIPLITKLRKQRDGITVETCHHYLTLSSESVPYGQAQFKCAPPIRCQENQKRLWAYLKNGNIDFVVSDHSPCSTELKHADFMKSWGGISSVQYGLSLFWTGAQKRGFKLCDVAKFLSASPAKFCRLDNIKGAIKPGLDADFVIFDPEAKFVVSTDDIKFKNKTTPYIGMELTGKVVKTFLRGKEVFSQEHIVQPTQGRLLINV